MKYVLEIPNVIMSWGLGTAFRIQAEGIKKYDEIMIQVFARLPAGEEPVVFMCYLIVRGCKGF